MKFKGTILAVIIIILLLAVMKLGRGIGFERRDVLVEPTETPTFGFLENTSISSMPTEN